MLKFWTLFLFALIPCTFIAAQQNFKSPVDHTIRLSGTFGELRSNHFHTGLDIKSANARVGDPIKAVWDGHISRIHINIAGYGNALYIDHPNGMTSVYAHLHEFSPALDSILMDMQYSQQTHEIDTLLPDTLFPIKQGDIIGKMGTSGYSFGPHLHFELRTTITERPINPLLGYIQVEDDIPPQIKSLYVYTLDDQKKVIHKKRITVTNHKSTFSIEDKTVTVQGPYAAIGVESYDRSNNSKNKNGVYQIDIQADDTPIFKCSFDSLNFNYKTLINTHIDYEEKKKNKKNVHRCFLYDVGHPNLGDQKFDKGFIGMSDSIATPIIVRVKDQFGNTSELRFSLKGSDGWKRPKHLPITNTDIPFHSSVLINLGKLKAHLEKNSFETDYSFTSDTTHDRSKDIISPVYHLGKDQVALLHPMHLQYDLSPVADSLQSKCYIGGCVKDKYVNHGSLRDGETIYTEVHALGDYMILLDTIPPKIQPTNWSEDWSDLTHISFEIKDNVDAKSKAKDLISHATIDGQWMLMKYDYKNDLIRYDMDLPLSSGVYPFKLSVTDDLGNTSHFNEIIYIK